MLFLLAAACGASGDAVPADVGCQPGGRTVPELVRGGGLGSGGALPPGWGYGWAWGGLGPGWCAAGSMGWCMRLGPALVWGSRCIGASAGGSNRGGVNGPYLGVLLSYVVWELTG